MEPEKGERGKEKKLHHQQACNVIAISGGERVDERADIANKRTEMSKCESLTRTFGVSR